MKYIKHFYYPYYYIEQFNGSISSIFFLDETFHYEDELDLFISRSNFSVNKKSKKVIESSISVSENFSINSEKNSLQSNFFNEFFL